jgi:phosphate transport system permease protein
MPSAVKIERLSWRRRVMNHAATAAGTLTALLVIAPLLAVFGYLVVRGLGALSWTFLTHVPAPVGETGGGMGNAIAGSTLILAVGSAIGIPLGIGTGIFMAEYARGPLPKYIRFISDLLNGVPSIVIGIAVYSLVVLKQKHFSAFSGGIALGIMMIPTIARSTEEMLLMVPQAVREAALGLGIPRWRATASITLRSAMPGVMTGIMLAFARVAGETAPLLFTAFGNQFWNWNINQPTAALPLQIFAYAISPYDEWHRQAWAGALVLIVLIVGAVSAVRLISRRGVFMGAQ